MSKRNVHRIYFGKYMQMRTDDEIYCTGENFMNSGFSGTYNWKEVTCARCLAKRKGKK